MIRQDNLTVCDYCSTCLEDGVTLFPGYIQVNNFGGFKNFSHDPNNESKSPFTTKNRLHDEVNTNYKYTTELNNFSELGYTDLETRHFCNTSCLKNWVISYQPKNEH